MTNACSHVSECEWWYCRHFSECLLSKGTNRKSDMYDKFVQARQSVVNAKDLRKKKKLKDSQLTVSLEASRACRELNIKSFPDQPPFTESDESCYYCTRHRSYAGKLTRDHIIPKSRGGRGKKNNVVWACSRCNGWKGSKFLHEWLDEIETKKVTPGGYAQAATIMSNIKTLISDHTYLFNLSKI